MRTLYAGDMAVAAAKEYAEGYGTDKLGITSL
jgi:hypothetical protein